MEASGKRGLQAAMGSREEWGSCIVYRSSVCKGPEVGALPGMLVEEHLEHDIIAEEGKGRLGEGQGQGEAEARPCRLFYQFGLCVHV